MLSHRNSNVFYGWNLCLLASFGNFMIQGSSVFLLNAFIEPFQELYGWSRGDLGTVLGIGSFCGMAAVPLLASLSMKISLRWIMTTGALLGGISLFMLGQFSSITLFALNFCVLWIAGQACGGVVANALMSNWFIKHRGKAFGIVSSGMSLSGAVLPFVALILIKLFSVQMASAILGIFLLIVLLPTTWFFVRDTPESMGLIPDGTSPGEQGAPTENTPQAPLSIREFLRNPLTYRIGIPFTLSLMASAGVVGQLKPRFSDLGFDDFTAMSFMCATTLFIAGSKYVWGYLSDRFSPLKTARFFFLYSVGAFLLALLPSNLLSVSLFCLLCGLALGGTWTLLPAVVVSVFGRANFMAAYRVIVLFLFFRSLGYIMMGQIHQFTGSYDAAYIAFSMMFLLAFFISPSPGTTPCGKSG